MHHRAIDLTGQRFGYLTAMSYAGSNGQKSLWTVKCDCGTQKVLVASELRQGRVRSCGCQMGAMVGASQTTHGLSRHQIFAVWSSMIQRCQNPKHKAYHNYGGRGITVCKRWQTFQNFADDMLPTWGLGLTLERKDNNSGYRKSNCEWVSYKEQARNRRGSIRINGLSVADYARSQGISTSLVYYRFQVGHLTSSTPGVEINS